MIKNLNILFILKCTLCDKRDQKKPILDIRRGREQVYSVKSQT